MAAFTDALRSIQQGRCAEGDRTWLFVAYDQLNAGMGPLARRSPDEVGIVLVESSWKARRRPYHKQKLALILANQRHFALEQARRGVAVRYVFAAEPYDAVLRSAAEDLGPIVAMEPAERELRRLLRPLVEDGCLVPVEHDGWLTSSETFEALGDPPWRMDVFYRRVRKQTGILMEDGSPTGGKFSHDRANREPWKGSPAAPTPPAFDADPITEEVCALVRERFADHPGRLDPARLPATLEDAERAWSWALEHCMPHFGPYEDAMSTASRTLFHTLISPLLNLHRLLARDVLADVLERALPLNSKEGFVRQLIGWREFVRHVHRRTDGFRDLPDGVPPIADVPGDAGWWALAGDDAPAPSVHPALDGGAAPSRMGADQPIPPVLWGTASGLRCLDTVVGEVLETGYSHHITRLMVVSNLATLLDWSPRALTNWFWCAYIDAYDWVVEPNVLGMGTFAVGELMTTKPYVSGAAYIDKMSDFCGGCAFEPKSSCPVTRLYWAFLDRHRATLAGNHRMRLPLASSAKRSATRKAGDAAVFEALRAALADGACLDPEALTRRVERIEAGRS